MQNENEERRIQGVEEKGFGIRNDEGREMQGLEKKQGRL